MVIPVVTEYLEKQEILEPGQYHEAPTTSGGHKSFPDLWASEESGIITNRIDEAQEQQLEAAHRSALLRSFPRSVLDPRVEYGSRSADPTTEAKDTITRSLGVYLVGLPVTTQAELNHQKALQTLFLVPREIPMDRYSARLRAQKEGAPVPTMQTIPVVPAPGETAADDDELFEQWCSRTGTFLRCALQRSHKVVDVRVECHLRFELAKFKAQRRLPA
ncbi:uncharacterized protein PHALS_11169 [Plasmopara halstedii]|uniref:Uncharacterized protein n=1 Tax=Plasmopara halstedii TaxID=4781 RepID=A0A0P1AIX7_PLAHL|nr:uncharacterized protein PHALS_11169 [Plasmopara halstedii]CEG40997.1 hypothetical protein PHALS_11169 [Plasmopara halstedii]|eukprot:XP_024577366.1 hypothetical protein PHALS_11169 [Plasmopara halstedii]